MPRALPCPAMEIMRVDHVGIRVRDADRSLAFYANLGFEQVYRDPHEPVIVVRNPAGVELNLIVNAHADEPNMLMDVPEKHAGITHVALRVDDIDATVAHMRQHGIEITEGPVRLGPQISLFVRDPDRTVIELNAPAPDDGA